MNLLGWTANGYTQYTLGVDLYFIENTQIVERFAPRRRQRTIIWLLEASDSGWFVSARHSAVRAISIYNSFYIGVILPVYTATSLPCGHRLLQDLCVFSKETAFVMQNFRNLGDSSGKWGWPFFDKTPNFMRFEPSCVQIRSRVFFIAPHRMQTWSSDENSVRPSVRPSVCLSHAWIVTKR